MSSAQALMSLWQPMAARHGSSIRLSTNIGAVSDNFVYDSFGNVISSTGSFIQPFRYTSREWNAETGLYYYRARYYDPIIGRFLSEDPLGMELGRVIFTGMCPIHP